MKVAAGQAMQTQVLDVSARQGEQQLRQSWRQSWERAQWEWASQTRSTPLATEAVAKVVDETAMPRSHPQAPTAYEPAAAFTQSPVRIGVTSAKAEPQAIVEIIAQQTGVPQEEIAFVPRTVQAKTPSMRVARSSVAAAPLRHAFGDLAQSPTMVAVALDGRQLVVTVRDSTLSQADQQTLVKRLRAELHARGFDLVGVWINGCAWDASTAQPQADFV